MLIGSPTLDLYVNSWNAKYPNNKIFTAKKTDMTDSIGWGYYVGNSENPTTYDVSKLNTDTLYYPHNTLYESCNGYWLASPSAEGPDSLRVIFVNYNGYMDGSLYYGTVCAFRPVVCLPSNILQ